MKKIMFIAAAAILCLSACKGPALPKTVEEFDALVEEKVDEVKAKVEALEEQEEIQAIVTKFYEEMNELCLKVAQSKFATTELRIQALLEAADEMDKDEFEAILAKLPEEAREDAGIIAKLDSYAAIEATAEGEAFTDFEVDGVKFSDFVGKGKYILVDFWASWCGPCKREIPFIKAVWEKYAGEDFGVLGLAVWDKPEDTEAAIKDLEIPWPQIINCQKIPTDIYGVDGIPHLILISPDGVILRRGLRGEAIEEAVAEALGR